MYTCQNGTNTMSEINEKETLVERTLLGQSHNHGIIEWASFLERMRSYQVWMNAPRPYSFSVDL